tara:strand:+ start:773 stop:967 length:195 start_codon:yes stop_codon:yes gene_type:complete
MKQFKSYYFSFIGISLVGISIGYVIGFYIKSFYLNNSLSYLSVIPMGVGCAMIIYGSLFTKCEK